MCGISGLLNINKKAKKFNLLDIEGVKKTVEVQKHRGPDDQGLCGFSYCRDKIYNKESDILYGEQIDGIFGFDRLSIKDLSEAGHQPMLSQDQKVMLVFNGEIYNDKELRDEMKLRGYSFRGRTDTEVILALYLQYGFEQMLKKLNGMFAIAIVDLRTKAFWAARDRYGIKPFYYTIFNNRFGFASELKAIIQFDNFKRELDMEAFDARLIFSRPSNQVLLKNVNILDPGSVLYIKYGESPRCWKYYDINAYERQNDRYKNINEAMEDTIDIISKAVSRQMVSDVKVGCQLSGGIDSTIVSYFANKNKTDIMNDAVSIIDEKGTIGEEKYIEYVGEKLDLQLHKFTIDPKYFTENYEKIIWYNDAPVYQPFFICFYKLAQEAKQYVTVLLSGEGSDEIAGGYSRFSDGVYQPFIKKISGDSICKAYDTYAEYAIWKDQTIVNPQIYSDPETEKKLFEKEIEVFETNTGSNLTRHLKYEISQRLPEALLRQDKMTMANSIENRVPLLDNEVVDHIMELPEDMLVHFTGNSPMDLSDNPFEWVQGKYIFKEIVAKYFGRDFSYRNKQIMALDKRTMVTDRRFKEYCCDAVFPQMKSRGIINADYVKKLFLDADRISNADFTSMWRAIGLETWCQLFL